jgi:hypothetical protein
MNERLERLGEEFADDPVEFLCECADPSCSTPLSIPVSLYEAVREHPRWFMVLPGHQREDVERVVQEHADCLVIEKLGKAGRSDGSGELTRPTQQGTPSPRGAHTPATGRCSERS